MSTPADKMFIQQLEAAIKLAKGVKMLSGDADFSDMDYDPRALQAITANRAAVARAAGVNSAYSKQVEEVIHGPEAHGMQAVKLGGITEALLSDLQAGFLTSYAAGCS